ncbi:glycoside hydrolase family 16 protein [Sphingomonas sp. XXL09]|uniref:glycoside hydrolase family 16 protein n=1 Tax=Sphingomonas sp. XXL09 TaxID=3457787 RepID=UPI00406BBFF9
MLLALAMLQATTLGATNYAADQPIAAPMRKPVFADEFSGSTVDDLKWHFDISRNREGWPNHELEYYGPDNARVANGALDIVARKQRPQKLDTGGQSYTSARMVSRQAFGYGFYQIRAQLPCGRGMWPAIWLLPNKGSWPAMGEIDIMEMVGWDRNVIHATLHSAKYNHVSKTQRGAQIKVPTACSAWHDYQLDWGPDEILIGVDGRAYMRVVNDEPGDPAAWPFIKPFQLILNLAVGGDWGGVKGVDDAAMPQRMRVDYVRYWKQ